MKKILIFILLTITVNLQAQNAKKELENYLERNAKVIEKEQPIPLTNEDFNRQYFFFGFIHGSKKTQEIDLQLFKTIKSKNKLKYYAPEVDFSMAHYLNKYLKNGDENLLKDLVITYRFAAPQDASIAFYEKFQKLKAYNDLLPEAEKITILGTDRMVSSQWFLRQVKEMIPENLTTPDSILIKLKDYPEEDIAHLEFYDEESDLRVFFSENWSQLYENESNRKVFGDQYATWNHLIGQTKYFFEKKRNREQRIFNNFKNLLDLYDLKEQPVYFNFGYAHVLQAKFLNYSFLANKFKNEYSPENVLTVLAIMSETKVLWNTKFDKNGDYKGYGINWFGGEGDSIIERVKGISTLKKVTPKKSVVLYNLTNQNSPFKKDLYVIYTKKQLKKFQKNLVTTDFMQYVIHIRHSKANVPIQEMIK